jgi:hypothetical protein
MMNALSHIVVTTTTTTTTMATMWDNIVPHMRFECSAL